METRTAPFRLLDVVEDINKDYPVRERTWAVMHLYNASDDNLNRMKRWAWSWGVQDGLYCGGERLKSEVGVRAGQADACGSRRPLSLDYGAAVGTDAHRVSSYNPSFVAMYLDGTTIGGTKTRGAKGPSAPGAGKCTPQFGLRANDDDKAQVEGGANSPDLAVMLRNI